MRRPLRTFHRIFQSDNRISAWLLGKDKAFLQSYRVFLFLQLSVRAHSGQNYHASGIDAGSTAGTQMHRDPLCHSLPDRLTACLRDALSLHRRCLRIRTWLLRLVGRGHSGKIFPKRLRADGCLVGLKMLVLDTKIIERKPDGLAIFEIAGCEGGKDGLARFETGRLLFGCRVKKVAGKAKS